MPRHLKRLPTALTNQTSYNNYSHRRMTHLIITHTTVYYQTHQLYTQTQSTTFCLHKKENDLTFTTREACPSCFCICLHGCELRVSSDTVYRFCTERATISLSVNSFHYLSPHTDLQYSSTQLNSLLSASLQGLEC